jgi:peptidoglycan/xylan/chitin deacetylase (PgdA/CDA1 family)
MRQSYLCLPALLIIACTNTQGGHSSDTGGSPSNGGSSATASSSQGGSSTHGSGGTTSASASGGASNTGGAQATGGSIATGGTSSSSTTSPATGGSNPTGGSSATGGSNPTGGTNASGGGGPQGGSANGGNSPNGGSANGGAPKGGSASGGNSGGGGTSGGVGGAVTGGTKANGGSATGGSTSGGGAVASSCANLSFAPATTGKAKPSAAAGGLKVLDWAGFQSAISYSFDDANSSQINNYQAMKDAGGHYTFYLITSKTEASNAVYKTAVKDGHEMGNHTSDHSNCTSASTIDAASTFIKNTFGVTAYAFAAPNGSSACDTTSVSSKFLTDRSVAGNSSIGPGDISSFSWLPADIPSDSASSMGPIAGKWRVFCIHGFVGGSDGAYQPVTLSNFTSAAKSAVSGGSWVETVTNVAAYQVGQNVISKATGNSITWTLPSIFPPNMCVRVTTTGGTVKQNGSDVPWDDHGYYQISLDAKSLTIE